MDWWPLATSVTMDTIQPCSTQSEAGMTSTRQALSRFLVSFTVFTRPGSAAPLEV